MSIRNFHAFHDAQQRAYEAAQPLMDESAAYAAEQGPVDADEAVTDYRDRRGK